MSNRTHSGGVCHIRYHPSTGSGRRFVWCPKSRPSVLTGAIAPCLEALIHEEVAELDGSVLALEIQPDHVHPSASSGHRLFVEMPPKWAPAQIAYRLKGYTSHVLRREFPRLRSRLPSLWSRSYYVGTAGEVSAETIRRYIEAQRGK